MRGRKYKGKGYKERGKEEGDAQWQEYSTNELEGRQKRTRERSEAGECVNKSDYK